MYCQAEWFGARFIIRRRGGERKGNTGNLVLLIMTYELKDDYLCSKLKTENIFLCSDEDKKNVTDPNIVLINDFFETKINMKVNKMKKNKKTNKRRKGRKQRKGRTTGKNKRRNISRKYKKRKKNKKNDN